MTAIVFAIDQLQTMFTGQSVFSALIGMMGGIIIAEAIHGAYHQQAWTPEQRSIALRQFNIFAPFTRKQSAICQLVNAIWSVVVTYLLSRGLNKIFQKVDIALGISTNVPLKALYGQYRTMGIDLDEYLTRAYQVPEVRTRTLAVLKQAGVKPALQRLVSGAPNPQLLGAVKTTLTEMGMMAGVPLLYKVVYFLKQLVGSLISPTEFIELAVFIKSGASSQLTINNKPANWWWNFGDNIVFFMFKDDTTWGMFKAIGAAIHGDWSHFTRWPTLRSVISLFSGLPQFTFAGGGLPLF